MDIEKDERLRGQRDRFLAFAFCGAEVLAEVDADNCLSYCAGTTEHLFGEPASSLKGRPINSLVYHADAKMMLELMKRVRTSGRLDRVMVRLKGQGLAPFRAVISGIVFPERPGLTYLTISRAQRGDKVTENTDEIIRGAEDFAALAERRLREAAQFGENYELTLIDLGSTDALQERMEPAALQSFVQGVEAHLRAWSVDGASVGQIDETKFGVIHERGIAPGEMKASLIDIAAVFGGEIEIMAASLDLAAGTMTDDDIGKAIVYTLNRFVEEGGENFAVKSLTASYQQAVDETLAKVNAFRQSLASDSFTLVYQPIVNLKTWTVHHYEALARMRQGDRLFLPARFIGFAEEFGVVHEFDIMILSKAIAALKSNTGLHPSAEIAVNLSGRSISDPAFVQHLMLTLVENRPLLPRLMFELTESSELRDLEAANRVLQKLRSFGCKISIDDFGAGAAAFQYLKSLNVDYVKIDGSYILDAFTTPHGRPFLKAIASLAADMGIKTIGEMVEDNRTMWLLHDVGVDYGQGYFFARPSQDMSTFKLPARPVKGKGDVIAAGRGV